MTRLAIVNNFPSIAHRQKHCVQVGAGQAGPQMALQPSLMTLAPNQVLQDQLPSRLAVNVVSNQRDSKQKIAPYLHRRFGGYGGGGGI